MGYCDLKERMHLEIVGLPELITIKPTRRVYKKYIQSKDLKDRLNQEFAGIDDAPCLKKERKKKDY